MTLPAVAVRNRHGYGYGITNMAKLHVTHGYHVITVGRAGRRLSPWSDGEKIWHCHRQRPHIARAHTTSRFGGRHTHCTSYATSLVYKAAIIVYY